MRRVGHLSCWGVWALFHFSIWQGAPVASAGCGSDDSFPEEPSGVPLLVSVRRDPPGPPWLLWCRQAHGDREASWWGLAVAGGPSANAAGHPRVSWWEPQWGSEDACPGHSLSAGSPSRTPWPGPRFCLYTSPLKGTPACIHGAPPGPPALLQPERVPSEDNRRRNLCGTRGLQPQMRTQLVTGPDNGPPEGTACCEPGGALGGDRAPRSAEEF